jgi:oxaloacetate decarboxylase alpha subunit
LELTHPEFMELVYARLVANGIDRFGVIDPTNDPDAAPASYRQIRRASGAEIVAALTYYARYAACPDVDRVYPKDPGLLTPERAATLPALRTGGTSLPDAQRLVANLRELGHAVDVDDRLLGLAHRFDKMIEEVTRVRGPVRAFRPGKPDAPLGWGSRSVG